MNTERENNETQRNVFYMKWLGTINPRPKKQQTNQK